MVMYHAFLKKIEDEGIIEPADSLLLGLSGGVDSVVLLNLLSEIKNDLGLRIACAHVNYGLRGRESDRDEKFVRGLAKKYGVPCVVASCGTRRNDLPNLRAGERHARLTKFGGLAMTGNLQNSARDFRYDFFIRTAKKIGANKIAVAHHADDQAETMLLHLMRGSGLKGLSGMASSKPLGDGLLLVRPLLPFSKTQISAFAKKRGLKFVEDRTNRTNKYTRNIVRNSIIPLLARYNPNVIEHLCKTARLLKEDNQTLDDLARGVLKTVATAGKRRVTLPRGEILRHPKAIQGRILRLAFAKLIGDTADLMTDHVEKMLHIIRDKKVGSYCLPRGVRFARNGDKISLKSEV